MLGSRLLIYTLRKLHFVAMLHRKPNAWYAVGAISVTFMAFHYRKYVFS